METYSQQIGGLGDIAWIIHRDLNIYALSVSVAIEAPRPHQLHPEHALPLAGLCLRCVQQSSLGPSLRRLSTQE